MTYILRDGKVYKQYEEEVDIAKEEYTLQAWKDALISDQKELEDYTSKIEEIESLKVQKSTKDFLKEKIPFYSSTGITQEMVDAQQAKVDEIRQLNGNII